MKITEIHIQGRRWFQKTYGNTYNTTKSLVIYKNGSSKEFYTSMEYGYGDHYRDFAIDNLVKQGVLKPKKDKSSYYWSDFNDLDIKLFYNATDVLKRDLHQPKE